MRPACIKTIVVCLVSVMLTGCSSESAIIRGPAGVPQGLPKKHTVEVVFTPQPEAAGKSSVPKASASPSPKISITPSVQAMPVQELAAKELPFSELAPTTTMSFEELVGDNGIYEEPEGYPSPDTFRVIVDLRYQVVLVYKRSASGEYNVPVRYMLCSTGKSTTPTPRGSFSAGDSRVRFGLFVNNGVYGQYWTQITRRIYFHSILYTKKNAGSYTKTSYNQLGKRVSHGCVRLLVPDARWVYYHVAPGTSIEIRKGDAADTKTASIREQLTRPKLPDTRQTLEPGEVPYTDTWTIETYLKHYKTVPAV